MIHYMRRAAAPLPPPPRFTPAQTLAGFRTYQADCEVRHGGPGVRTPTGSTDEPLAALPAGPAPARTRSALIAVPRSSIHM